MPFPGFWLVGRDEHNDVLLLTRMPPCVSVLPGHEPGPNAVAIAVAIDRSITGVDRATDYLADDSAHDVAHAGASMAWSVGRG